MIFMTQMQGEPMKNMLRSCWRKGCHVDAVESHRGVRLCLVHFLRARVEWNLSRIQQDESHAA